MATTTAHDDDDDDDDDDDEDDDDDTNHEKSSHSPVPLHYGFRWPIRFWNVGKVPKSTLLFLAHFYPHNQKIIFLTQEWPQFCVNKFWTHFHKEKMENLRRKEVFKSEITKF